MSHEHVRKRLVLHRQLRKAVLHLRFRTKLCVLCVRASYTLHSIATARLTMPRVQFMRLGQSKQTKEQIMNYAIYLMFYLMF